MKNVSWKNTVLLIAIIAIFIVVFIGFLNKQKSEKIVSKVKKAIQDKSTIQGDYKDLSLNQALNPNYHNTVQVFNASDVEQARVLAKKIHDADHYLNDDEDAVYTAISSASTKAFLSLVSEEFEKLYEKNMLTYITAFLDTEELNKVKDIISQLS